MHFAFSLLLVVGSFGAIKTTDPEPRLIYRFLVDNTIVEMPKGAPASGKFLTVSYKLDEQSEHLFPELQQQPITIKCLVSLARGSRRIATISSDLTGHMPLIYGAVSGDRLLIEIQEIRIKQKDGNWMTLNDKAKYIHTIPLY